MSKFTILTIEDQADVRRLIRFTLEYDGFDVLEASRGAMGLDMARSNRPDLVLLDVMMPDMSGLAVAEAMSQDPILSQIPFVMLTALGQASDKAAGMKAGAKAYLTKPFRPIDLSDLVHQLIKQQQTPRV